jgi:hypothetical protein
MSLYHCLCGLACDDPDEFGDHFRLVFMPDGDTGNDGLTHAEITSPGDPRNVCSCGLAADDPSELDDHFLMVFTPADSIGTDGLKHIPADPKRFRVTGPGALLFPDDQDTSP